MSLLKFLYFYQVCEPKCVFKGSISYCKNKFKNRNLEMFWATNFKYFKIPNLDQNSVHADAIHQDIKLQKSSGWQDSISKSK